VRNIAVRGNLNEAYIILFVFLAVVVLEFYGYVFERVIGHYLKWHNASRQQLGRIWDKEQKNVLAQSKAQSILSTLGLQEQSSESIESFKVLFETLTSSRIITREKFLQLYFDYPGQWTHPIITPYEMIEIDSIKTWNRVLFDKADSLVTVSFIDVDNNPIHEVVLSDSILTEVRDMRTVRRGRLDEIDFKSNLIFPARDFLPLLQTLDPVTQRILFPDPKWFLLKGFHLTRIGILTEEIEPDRQTALLGIEYERDFLVEVLLVPVPLEIANNVLSQIEKSDSGNSETSSQRADMVSHGEKN
jgi:hypothetical protein